MPIDPEYPVDRVAYILQDSGAGALVTTAGRRLDAVIVDTIRRRSSRRTKWKPVPRREQRHHACFGALILIDSFRHGSSSIRTKDSYRHD